MGAKASSAYDSCCKNTFFEFGDNECGSENNKSYECPAAIKNKSCRECGTTVENPPPGHPDGGSPGQHGKECAECRNIKTCPKVEGVVEALEERKRKVTVLKTLDRWEVAPEYRQTMVEYFTKNTDALDSITGNTNDCYRPAAAQAEDSDPDLPAGVVVWHREVHPEEHQTTTEIAVGAHRVEIHPKCDTATVVAVDRSQWLAQDSHEKAYKVKFKPSPSSDDQEIDHDPDPECWVAFTTSCPRTHVWLDGIAMHCGPLVNLVIYPKGSLDEFSAESEDRKLSITSTPKNECKKCGRHCEPITPPQPTTTEMTHPGTARNSNIHNGSHKSYRPGMHRQPGNPFIEEDDDDELFERNEPFLGFGEDEKKGPRLGATRRWHDQRDYGANVFVL